MKSLIIRALALTLFSSVATAQPLQKISLGHSCSFFGEKLPENIVAFQSDNEAEKVIADIVAASGLAQNFEIQAAGVPNAAAVIKQGKRYILYNQHFMQKTKSITNNEWSPISVMAHEIGHHLNGHTLDDIGSRPAKELEADYYSGFILQRLGATMEDARSLMAKVGPNKESKTHSASHDRLAAIDNGWMKACEADLRCQASGNVNRTKDTGFKENKTSTIDSSVISE